MSRRAAEPSQVAFFAYLTDLDTVSLSTSVEVEASGHDMTDLLYHLLDESLGSGFLHVAALRLRNAKCRNRGPGVSGFCMLDGAPCRSFVSKGSGLQICQNSLLIVVRGPPWSSMTSGAYDTTVSLNTYSITSLRSSGSALL